MSREKDSAIRSPPYNFSANQYWASTLEQTIASACIACVYFSIGVPPFCMFFFFFHLFLYSLFNTSSNDKTLETWPLIGKLNMCLLWRV